MKRVFLIALFLWLHGLAIAVDSDLSHGNKQLESMLADRPAMAEFSVEKKPAQKLSKEDTIWQWAAKAYGKKVNDGVIEWDNGKVDKPPQYQAEHVIPSQTTKGVVRIRETILDSRQQIRPATFDEMWACCVFELINITNAPGFLKIYREAIAGRVTKAEWVRLNTELEYSALVQLRTFFREIWIPWSQKNNHSYESFPWLRGMPMTYTYNEWIDSYQGTDIYRYWEDYYDKTIVPYLDKVKQFNRLQKWSQPLLERPLIEQRN